MTSINSRLPHSGNEERRRGHDHGKDDDALKEALHTSSLESRQKAGALHEITSATQHSISAHSYKDALGRSHISKDTSSKSTSGDFGCLPADLDIHFPPPCIKVVSTRLGSGLQQPGHLQDQEIQRVAMATIYEEPEVGENTGIRGIHIESDENIVARNVDSISTSNHNTPTQDAHLLLGSTFQAPLSGAFPMQAQYDRPGVLMELPNGLPNGYQQRFHDSHFSGPVYAPKQKAYTTIDNWSADPMLSGKATSSLASVDLQNRIPTADHAHAQLGPVHNIRNSDLLATLHVKKGPTGDDAGLPASIHFPSPWILVSQFHETQSITRNHPPMVGKGGLHTPSWVGTAEDPSHNGFFSKPTAIPERGVGSSLIANRKNLLPFRSRAPGSPIFKTQEKLMPDAEMQSIVEKLPSISLFELLCIEPNLYAVQELQRRSWSYQPRSRRWFKRKSVPHEMTTDYERGDYWCLEFKHQDGCQQLVKHNMTIDYCSIE